MPPTIPYILIGLMAIVIALSVLARRFPHIVGCSTFA